MRRFWRRFTANQSDSDDCEPAEFYVPIHPQTSSTCLECLMDHPGGSSPIKTDIPESFSHSIESLTEYIEAETEEEELGYSDCPPPYSPITPGQATKNFQFWTSNLMDHSNKISYKRPENTETRVYAELCRENCTCYLDPVELNCVDELFDPNYDKEVGPKRNKLNLTIDTTVTKNWCFKEPVYDLIMNSPVIKKLRDFGFTFPEEEEEPWKRKFLYCAICILLLFVIALLVINAVVPHLLRSLNESTKHRNYSQIPLRYYSLSELEIQIRKEEEKTKFKSPAGLITGLPNDLKSKVTKNGQLIQSTVSLDKSLTSTTALSSSTPTSTISAVISTWLPTFSSNIVCGQDQFKCRNGVSRVPCLYEWERCDGIQDCSDGSDEQFCEKLNCYGNFECGDGECVSLAKVCNGISDCADGKDEHVCDKFECKPYEFRCPSGYCIPHEWLCDGDMDCPDHRDEYNCSSICSNDQFMCGEGWCIPDSWRCNGIPDCAGGEDERDCGCSINQTQCLNGGCVDQNQICDGLNHCSDGSDEWDCFSNDQTLTVFDAESQEMLPVCADGWTEKNSKLLCRQLGFSNSTGENKTLLDTENTTDVFTLSPKSQAPGFETQTLQHLVKKIPIEKCTSKMSISVTCQQFDCGVWHPSDRKSTEQKRRRKRVVGGHVSAKHQWPSVAVLYHPHKRWTCTASIISPYWVLTSALCVRRTDKSAFDWRLIAGSAEPKETDKNVLRRKIDKFIIHPSYKFRSVLADYDVMLVRLATPLELSQPINGDYVGAICLPPEETVPDSLCVTAGWGYTTPGGYFINKQLRHLSMNVWNNSKCNGSEHYTGLVTDRMLCARNDHNDWQPCFNDEGAPLMCHNKKTGSWYLAGVMTLQNCGSKTKHPVIFADVFAVKQWISKTVFGK